MKLIALLLVTVCSSFALGYSRGPYLPQSENLVLPGELLSRGNLNERCEERYEDPCDPYSEYVLVKSTSGAYEFGAVKYDCQEIDDGAYGALSCKQNGYVTMKTFASCSDQQGTVAARGDFVYRDWICTP